MKHASTIPLVCQTCKRRFATWEALVGHLKRGCKA